MNSGSLLQPSIKKPMIPVYHPYEFLKPFSGPLGINGLSPQSDDIFNETPTSKSLNSPIGEPLQAPHMLELFESPSQQTQSFLHSLTLSPSSILSRGYFETDEELSDFSLPPSVMSDHESFLMGFGGMDDLDEETEQLKAPFGNSNSLLSPSSSPVSYVNRSYSTKNTPTPKSPLGNSSISLSTTSQSPDLLSSSPNQSGEHPFGEHPSRTLFVRNINSNVDDQELRTLFENYGPIRSMYTQCKHRGFVMVSYFDIRHAKSAMKHLQNKPLRRRKLDIHYSIPKDNPSEKDQNQGTLVVFNLDPTITTEELLKIFGTFGEVKEIRETPNKKHHKFIEFYDVRDAEMAMKSLNKTEIKSKKIKIEPSRPGGRKSNNLTLSPTLEGFSLNPSSRLISQPRTPTLGPSDWIGDSILSKSAPESNLPLTPTLTAQEFLKCNTTTSHPQPIQKPYQPSPPKTNLPTVLPTPWQKPGNHRSIRSTSLPPRKPTNQEEIVRKGASSPSPYHPTASYEDKKFSIRNEYNKERNSFALDIANVRSGIEKRTTLMIKNIPNKYTQKLLLATIDETHQGLYDFFYLPIDFKNKCNVGYAFINFIDPLSIISLFEKLHNRKWERFNSEKVCEITYARIQGKENLISHFQNSSLLSEDKKCRPIVFHTSGPLQGQPAPFPTVTRSTPKEDKGRRELRVKTELRALRKSP